MVTSMTVVHQLVVVITIRQVKIELDYNTMVCIVRVSSDVYRSLPDMRTL